MESDSHCKEHGKLLQIYCTDCSSLLCLECLAIHRKKGCKYPFTLAEYAKEEMLPKYEILLKDIDKSVKNAEESAKELHGKMKDGLSELKIKMECLLSEIKKTLTFLDGDKNTLAPSADSLKKRIEEQYEEFKEAIKSENISYIINKVNSKSIPIETDDNENHLINGILDITSKILKVSELNLLRNLMQEFNLERSKISIDKPNAIGDYIYGVCNPRCDTKILCRFDMERKKLEDVIKIGVGRAVVQARKRIFITGGTDPLTDEVYEFIESNRSLVRKRPMIYKKWQHGVQALADGKFVTIGGRDSATMSICEKYSTATDKWHQLPSLNIGREFPATASFSKSYLYAIGGRGAEDKIEVINLHEKRSWDLLSVQGSSFGSDPAAFAIADTTIIIIGGSGKLYTCNSEEEKIEIEEMKLTTLPDQFIFNSVNVINKKVYSIGHKGHIHIYDIYKNCFDDISYFDAAE